MSTKDIDRGRTASPMRVNYGLGSSSSFSIRDRSPHIAMDRVTRHVSPARHKSMRNQTIEEVTPRVPQPYKTSFSAVTSPRIITRQMGNNANLAGSSGGGSSSSNAKFQPLGLSRSGHIRGTLSGGINASPVLKSSRAQSQDAPRLDNQKQETETSGQDRTLSCDTLDGPAGKKDHNKEPISYMTAGGFDNRRLNPKYSSTPTRLAKSPYASVDYCADKYSRLESNMSADTLDSVFAPSSPSNFEFGTDPDQSFGKSSFPTVCPEESDSEISKQPDLGYVEGRVERRQCLVIEYAHIVNLTHQKLMKEKKKKRLPIPNEETAQLVNDMMRNFECQDKADSCPATPHHQENGVNHGQKSSKNALGKKSLSSSITNFFRKITLSPKVSKKPGQKKVSKRSKSAGRLEGNRSVTDSSSSLMGYREISIDHTSASSDATRGSFDGVMADLNSTGRNSRRMARNSPGSASNLVDTDMKENSQQNKSKGGRLSRRDVANMQGGSRREMAASTSRVYLKSIEDNTMTNRIDENTVYKSFKEKQSPGYRRHAEAVSMRSQALKAVEISERSIVVTAGSTEDKRGSGGSSSTTGPTSPLVIDSTYYPEALSTQNNEARRVEDMNAVNKQAFFANQSTEEQSLVNTENQSAPRDHIAHDSGSESSLSSQSTQPNSGHQLQEPVPRTPHNASAHSSHDSHLHNGSLAEVHTQQNMDQQKSPSYVKLSCSVSGYKKYPKTSLPKVSPAKDCIEITTNNNIPQQNGHIAGDEKSQYKPSGTNFVKGLSQKFESYNDNKDGVGTSQQKRRTDKKNETNGKNANGGSNSSATCPPNDTVKYKLNSVSPHHHSRNGGSGPKAEFNSGASSSPSSSSPAVRDVQNTNNGSRDLTDGDYVSETVDSHNIDFRKARRAFDPHRRSEDAKADGPSAERTGKPKSPSTSSSSSSPHTVPSSSFTHSASGLSHSSKAFDSVEAAGANELHLDLNGCAGRQNGVDEVDEAVFSRDMQIRGGRDGVGGVDEGLSCQSEMLNGDITDQVTTPSLVKVGDLRENNCKLSQSQGSLDIVVADDDNPSGSSTSLSSDRQVAGSTGALSSSSSVPSKDGKYFLAVAKNEAERLNEHVARTEGYMKNTLSEEVLGKMRAAIGKATLLTTKKFMQFHGLCHQNITQSSEEQFITTSQDLAGFWDMVTIQVEDVYALFAEIEHIRQNGWKLEAKSKAEVPKNEKTPSVSSSSTPVKTSTVKKTPAAVRATPKSAKAQQASKARDEARRRLLEAKKAGRHMRKTSENEDVEIFIA